VQLTRLAVLGSPIAHSLSPALHRAAYGVLRLDWQYDAIEIDTVGLPAFIESCTGDWRGLSLTMPLKRDVVRLLDVADPFAELTGAANTVFFEQHRGRSRLLGFNTDVFGITQALGDAGVQRVTTVRMLGAGATAASALVAVAQLGARRVVVSARSPQKLIALIELGDVLGVDVHAARPDEADDGLIPEVVISTLPGGARHDFRFGEGTRRAALLLDVAYDPWPSELAATWLETGGRVVPGIEMLVNQALMQVRIFVGGSPNIVLPTEDRVLAAMRAAIGL
jgi:shikimate dehydrogenase